jgi:hypothetical protein
MQMSGFVKVSMKLLNTETLVIRNAIQEISLNTQDIHFLKVAYTNYDKTTFTTQSVYGSVT